MLYLSGFELYSRWVPLQLEWRLEHAISSRNDLIWKEITKNNSRVELCFPV